MLRRIAIIMSRGVCGSPSSIRAPRGLGRRLGPDSGSAHQDWTRLEVEELALLFVCGQV